MLHFTLYISAQHTVTATYDGNADADKRWLRSRSHSQRTVRLHRSKGPILRNDSYCNTFIFFNM